MYSAPDKLPKRFSIIQNVCDFTRLSLEMSNSLSISGQCSGEQMFFILPLLGVCIAVRESALHLLIKIWVLCTWRIELWTPCWHRYELMLISTSPDLSGGETNYTICMCFYFFIPASKMLIRNICDPGGITCEMCICSFLHKCTLLFRTEFAFLRRAPTFGLRTLQSPQAGYHSLSPMKKPAAGDY